METNKVKRKVTLGNLNFHLQFANMHGHVHRKIKALLT